MALLQALFRPRVAAILALATLLALSARGVGPRPSNASGPDLVRAELASYAADLTNATAVRYQVVDDLGHSMDTMKIIDVPGPEFAAVYHTWRDDPGVFDVHLATSPNLLDWTWRVQLSTEASQPTIRAASDGGYVTAWEVTPLDFDAHSYPKFLYYPSWQTLLAARPSKAYTVALSLSPCCEGTPNLYAATSATVDAGFHYLRDMVVDRQARAMMDWTSWTATKDLRLDTALTSLGVKGNIGDRDTIRFRSIEYMLLEGQVGTEGFDSERLFLVDLGTGVAEQVAFRTSDGSEAVSNATVELVDLNGKQALVFAAYVFSEGRQAGPVIWYRVLRDA